MTFDLYTVIRDRPAQAELLRVLGDPRGPREVPGEQRGSFVVNDAWRRNNLTFIPISALPGFPPYAGQQPVKGVTLHRTLAELFPYAWAEVVRQGIHRHLHSYDGAFMPRHILWNPQNDLSVHAFGMALDFDAATNGFGIPPGRMQLSREFVEVMERAGFHWGGRWDRPTRTGQWQTDGMHFQFTDVLPGWQAPQWQDMGFEAVAPAGPSAVWVRVRDGAGNPIPGEVVSILVSPQGQMLVDQTGAPRVFRVDSARQGERKVL